MRLFIDPRTCIDCGACADICPVDAAKPADRAHTVEVRAESLVLRGAARVGRARPGHVGGAELLVLDGWTAARRGGRGWTGGDVRDAELLLRSTAEVTLFDRLPVVGGLARFGVAPDHPSTKQIVATFERVLAHPRVRWRPGTEAVTAELESRYDAVVHAVGSFYEPPFGIPGEDADGSCPAGEMVAWYNNRPGAAFLSSWMVRVR